MKIRLLGTKLFHADGHTYRQTFRYDEGIVAFRNFANSPKNRQSLRDVLFRI